MTSSTKTIISIPSRILYKHNEDKEREMVDKSSNIKKNIENVMDDDSIMSIAEFHRSDELHQHLTYNRYFEEIELVRQYKKYVQSEPIQTLKYIVSNDLLSELKMDPDSVINSSDEHLSIIQNHYKDLMFPDEVINAIKE